MLQSVQAACQFIYLAGNRKSISLAFWINQYLSILRKMENFQQENKHLIPRQRSATCQRAPLTRSGNTPALVY